MNWYKKAKKFKEVNLKGKLQQAPNGFTYLKIPNALINSLFAIVDEEDIVKPPYDQKKYNSIGAHVTVIYDEEVKENDLEIKEIGEEFNFTLGEFKSTHPDGWDEVEEVYFVQIHSPELEALRKSYGLSKKVSGHEFHITVAVEKS